MPGTVRKSDAQKGAEAEVEGFRRDLGPFVVAAETTRMAMVFTDAQNPAAPIIFANDSFLTLTGYSRAETLGRSFLSLIADGEGSQAGADVAAAFVRLDGSDMEVRCRRSNGRTFWSALFVTPVIDQDGRLVQHFASFVDLTRHKEEADHLRFLLDELNHRTQNTLATVNAIAGQTLRGRADSQVMSDFEGRIQALAQAHNLLGSESWAAVTIGEILARILEPFGLEGQDKARFNIAGGEVRLKPKAAVTLAMVFHELATNAARHGALSPGSLGTIGVNWQVHPAEDGDRLVLQWLEAGGPLVTPPTHKGFGSRLLEVGLARELGGEVSLEYPPAGLICRIDMPAPLEAAA